MRVLIAEDNARGGTVDPLTGLLNRRAAVLRAREEAVRAADEGRGVTIARVAIDGIDEIAATIGSTQANAILRAVARAMQAELRPYHPLGRWSAPPPSEFLPGARWGGAELLLVLGGMEPAQATVEVARLRSALAPVRFEGADGRTFAPVLSVGLAGATAGEQPDMDLLLECAQAGLDAIRQERASA